MTTISIEEILTHFGEVRRTAAGWRVRCPAHVDNHPSLDLSTGMDGTVLFCCRSNGCGFKEIVRAAGLENYKLGPSRHDVHVAGFHSAPIPISGRASRSYSTSEIRTGLPWKSVGLKVQAVYEYTDERENPVFAVVRLVDRTGQKSFRQCRAMTADRWLLGLDGVETLVYHLPKVLRAATLGERIFVVEGEKDVQTLESWGFTATTNPMGAGKWKPVYSEALRGAKQVVLLPDNDDAGRKHMADVASSLHALDILVHVLELPGLLPKGDVTDWIAAGGTSARLEQLIDQTPRYLPKTLVEPVADATHARTTPRPLPFPLIALPDALAQFVDDAAKAFQCPPDYIGVPVLAVASAVIGTTRALKLREGWLEVCRLFAAVVAPPGCTKSPALAHVLRPLHELQWQCDEAHRAALELFEAERARVEEERGKRFAQLNEFGRARAPVHTCLLTTDATREALGDLLSKSPRGLLLYADELTAWVSGMNQYKSGKGSDRQFFLSLWSGQPLYIHRKSAPPVHVYRPFLSVVGCIPPDMLAVLADGRGREDGFLHRILFAYPEPVAPTAWAEHEVSTDASDNWQLTIRNLRELLPGPDQSPVVLDLSPAGKSTWIELFNQHRACRAAPDLAPKMVGPLAKLESYAGRLTLVIHLLRVACGELEEGEVDDQSVAAGWALADYFAAHAERVYPRVHADPADRRVEQVVSWLRRRGGRCSGRDLITYEVAGVKKAVDAAQIMQEVVDRGWARLDERKAANGRGVTYLVLANG